MIIHDAEGARIACAILSDGVSSALDASSFIKYDGYPGALAVSGRVGPMVSNETTQTFSYELSGVDTACASGPDGGSPNSCGIHIHSGYTCTDAALVGGHYYTGTVTDDPWTNVVYTSDGSGATSGSLMVTTGGSSGDVAGRAMVIHDHTGARIACAILGAATQVTLTASGFVPYYTSSANFATVGTVGPMTTVGTTQTFEFSLSGVDPVCASGPGGNPNSCGIHIHAGTSCVANALGHYYTAR